MSKEGQADGCATFFTQEFEVWAQGFSSEETFAELMCCGKAHYSRRCEGCLVKLLERGNQATVVSN